MSSDMKSRNKDVCLLISNLRIWEMNMLVFSHVCALRRIEGWSSAFLSVYIYSFSVCVHTTECGPIAWCWERGDRLYCGHRCEEPVGAKWAGDQSAETLTTVEHSSKCETQLWTLSMASSSFNTKAPHHHCYQILEGAFRDSGPLLSHGLGSTSINIPSHI